MDRVELVVLDFDGTFTRVDDEAAPFLTAYRAGLAELLGGDIDEEWERASRTIEADPERHGWEYEGRIIAPSHADPYIFAASVAQILLRDHGAQRGALTDRLYRDAYAKAATVFRDDAREVVEAALALGVPVVVVTNSRTADVQK
jgi:phosphoglycolate phosphatase-like HAD superfamily hydrolase